MRTLTPIEQGMLWDFFPTGNVQHLAKSLGLKVREVRKHARALGLEADVRTNAWTLSDDALLSAIYPTIEDDELAPLVGHSENAIGQRARVLGLRKVPKYHTWNDADDAYLSKHWANTSATDIARVSRCPKGTIYKHADRLGLKKDPEFLKALGRHMANTHPAILAHRLKKGNVPMNKGKKMSAEIYAKAAPTMFKKGQKSNTWKPVGTEVRDPDGYLKRKISDRKDIPARFNWKYVHVMLWEEKNGPVPPKHMVAFKDGKPENCVYENLQLLSMADNARRNGIHNLPQDLKATIWTLTGLKRRIKNHEHKEHHGPEGKPVRHDRPAEERQDRREGSERGGQPRAGHRRQRARRSRNGAQAGSGAAGNGLHTGPGATPEQQRAAEVAAGAGT